MHNNLKSTVTFACARDRTVDKPNLLQSLYLVWF